MKPLVSSEECYYAKSFTEAGATHHNESESKVDFWPPGVAVKLQTVSMSIPA